MPALDGVPLPPVNDTTWDDWAGAVDGDVRALNSAPPIVVKDTEPTAADYGGTEIPLNAIWIKP
jgi:hypothetical protein